MADVVIVGGGHNGLVAGCYLAKAGLDVQVLEGLDRPGGGARTEERVPGYLFDLHSAAHNIINMTSIPDELDLAGAGLRYQEMDPFSVAINRDGRRVRFFRSVEQTLDSIAEFDSAEAKAYDQFIKEALRVVKLILPAVGGASSPGELPGRIAGAAGLFMNSGLESVRDVLGSYEALLRRRLPSDHTRGPVAAFAAHAGVGPSVSGGALYGYWQAAYHMFGQWHGHGGSQALTDALVTRFRSFGGELRCSARVERIETLRGRISGVVLEGGERIATRQVITALDPKVALLELLDPPLGGKVGSDLEAVSRGNVVQALIHVATNRLPPYQDARAGDWNGLQSYVDSIDVLSNGWKMAEAKMLPDPLPLYCFTPSAIDDSLAPKGGHTVYVACPAAPAEIQGGWPNARERFIEAALDVIEARAPGFRDSIVGMTTFLPDEMERDEHWAGAHPMHIDISLDQIGIFRPTRALAGHRTPIEGLFISGAGTAPTGGIAGTPGKLAALALLKSRKPSVKLWRKLKTL